jgi:hypothetical protein
MAVLQSAMAYVWFARRNARLRNKTTVISCCCQCEDVQDDACLQCLVLSAFVARTNYGSQVATHFTVLKLDNVSPGFRLHFCEAMQKGVYHSDHVSECDELHQTRGPVVNTHHLEFDIATD